MSYVTHCSLMRIKLGAYETAGIRLYKRGSRNVVKEPGLYRSITFTRFQGPEP